MSAGEKHTLLLADGDCIQPIIYYSGQQVKEEEEEVHTKELNQQEEGQEEDEGQHWAGGGYTRQPVLLPFCMNVRTSDCGWGAEAVSLQQQGWFLKIKVPFPLFQLRYVSNVFGGGQRCAALSDRNVMGFIASLHELASSERKFYCKMCNVKMQIIRPLLELGKTAAGVFSGSLHTIECFNHVFFCLLTLFPQSL